MSNMDRREALRGLEVQTFDLLAEILPSEPWAVMLNFLLRAAAANGKRDLAQKLVRAGAEIGDALHEAVGGRHPDVVNDLLECGASIDTKDSRFGMSPLHFAREADIVQLLLLKGADKDAVDSHEYTPLYIAIHFDREAAALALLAAGAIVTLPCGAFRRTALHETAAKGHVNILRAVIEHGADVNAGDLNNYTALHIAATLDKVDAMDALVEAGANIGSRDQAGITPLHAAANQVKLNALLSLLNHGAQVNAQSDLLHTPLHYAASCAGTHGAADVWTCY